VNSDALDYISKANPQTNPSNTTQKSLLQPPTTINPTSKMAKQLEDRGLYLHLKNTGVLGTFVSLP